jgi:aldehyde dehydrogenase
MESSAIASGGVVNIVNGFGAELGRALVTNPKVAKAAFTGSTATGRLVMQYATENIIPVTLELGGNLQMFSSIRNGCR